MMVYYAVTVDGCPSPRDMLEECKAVKYLTQQANRHLPVVILSLDPAGIAHGHE